VICHDSNMALGAFRNSKADLRPYENLWKIMEKDGNKRI
jgi:hypothetical protein